MKKRITSILLALVLCLSLLPTGVLADDEQPWAGSGTQEDPYQLGTADQLALLSKRSAENNYANTYFKFVNDITLPENWTPIGTQDIRFSGNIDGGGHLLTVPEDEKALLGATENATLKNLNIYGESINGNGVVSIYTADSTKPCITIENVTLKSGTKTSGSGFISGYASGSHPVTIRNCTVEKGVTIGDGTASNVGSFGGDFNGTVIGCVSHATVQGVNYVGGICGNKGQTMGDYVIIDCIFDGTVTATGSYAGGISGGGYGGTSSGLDSAPNTPCVTILNCLCSGSITGSDKVGGILGAEPGVKECWNNGVGYIQSNLFTGSVTATADNAKIGGIVGYLSSLNNAMVISDNYYLGTAASKGIGMIEMVETHETSGSGAKYGRTDDPVGTDADKLTKAVTSAELTGGSVLEKLNAGMNSSGNWTQGTAYPVFTAYGEKHLVRIVCTALNNSDGVSQILGEDVLKGKTLTLQYSDGTTGTLSATDESVQKGYAPTAAELGKYLHATITVQGHQLEFNLQIKAPAPSIQDAVVYLTVSNKGVLATAGNGAVMADKPVTVKDINSDGKLTFNEALVAAHAAYNSTEGYTATKGNYGLSVTKLWGESTGNTLFFVNDEGLLSDVGTDTVAAGDHLVASVIADDVYYADWYSFFDKHTDTTTVGDRITLTLEGHLGMAGTDEDKANVGLAGITVKTADGTVLGTTDENGSVTFSFANAGTYIVTASGTVTDQVYDYTTYPDPHYVDVNCPIIAPACVVTVTAPVPPVDTDITVYFTLLGDEIHGEGRVVHTLKAGNLTTWIEKMPITVPSGSYVTDVVTKALGIAEIPYSNPSGNYIKSIRGLAEQKNGANSGWMYTLNGRHPNLGVAEQTLKSGDAIIFHYTDDYTKEQGSEAWGGGDSKEKKSETTTASLAPEVTAKNGAASAVVDNKAVTDAIAAAKADGAKEIVIAPTVKGSAGKVSVELPKTAVNDIVESSDAALNIQTDVGSIDIPNDTLSEILKAAGSTDIAMSVEKVNPTAVKDSLPAGAKLENAVAVEFSISSGDKTIASFGGKALEVSIPVDVKKFAEGKTYTAFVVSADGKAETTTAKIVSGEAVVEMRHFSTVVITDQVAAAAFSDVAAGAYYYDAVQWAAANGVTAGTDDTHFSPNRPCTRAQVVTFLWRAAGCPKAEGKTPFTDVAADTYYSDAVTWAYEQGITGGTSATTFSPNTAVTRAQVVTFLYRYEKPAAGTAVNPFADVQKNAYYYDAVQWAYADGVTDGTDETHFSPNTVCTRGQIVTFLYRDFDSELSESSGVEMRLAEAAAYVLKTTPAPRFGSVGGEWAVLGLARSGSVVPESYYADYYTALEKTVSEAKGVLSTRKYTEYSRVIVALAAIGIDARNVAGYDLTVPLGDYDNTVKQGTSGPVWALIALDSRNYPMPICPDAATSATRQMYIDRLLATQNTDGGWGIGAESASDVDMTAMALQALAKYQEQKAVAAAAERALAFLETAPRVSSESTAQVITALCELGKPVPDELTEELIAYHVSGGGYCHVRGGGVNRMSSEQALYALAAVQRVQTGMPSLYRMER